MALFILILRTHFSSFFPFISLAFLPEMTGKTYQEIEKFLLEQELNRIGNIKEDDL